MKFLDEAKVYIRSGDGGNGCLSFRREKFIEFGGPERQTAVPAVTGPDIDFGFVEEFIDGRICVRSHQNARGLHPRSINNSIQKLRAQSPGGARDGAMPH